MDNAIRELWDVFTERISGERAKEYSCSICESAQYFTADKDDQAVSWYMQKMTEFGLKNIEEIKLPADGKTSFGGMLMPKLWNVNKGTLTITSPIEKTIADYSDSPYNLMLYSYSTPEPRFKFTIVKEKELSREGAVFGDFGYDDGHAFITDNEPKIIITDHLNSSSAPDHAVQWHNFTINPFYHKRISGFSISPNKAQMIRDWLKQGTPVELCAEVNTEIKEGIVSLPTGVIPGKTDEEIFITGHLFEPGMDDNASGCALGLEIMGVIKKLIDEGILPVPRRTIRLLPSFECRGIQIYSYLHPERTAKMKAGIDIDMVAFDPKYPFSLIKTPSANPAYTDYFLSYLLDHLAENSEHKWREQKWEMNDNLLSDPAIGVPTSTLAVSDANTLEYYHNCLDVPNVASSYTLKNIGVLTATFIYFLSDSCSEEVKWLADVVCKRMAGEKVTKFRLDKVLGSLLELVDEGEKADFENYLEGLKSGIQVSEEKKEPVDDDLAGQAKQIIPTRTYRGLVGLDNFSPAEFSHYKDLGNVQWWMSPVWLNECLFLCDGRRDLMQIKEILDAEGLEIDIEKVIAYFTFFGGKKAIEL